MRRLITLISMLLMSTFFIWAQRENVITNNGNAIISFSNNHQYEWEWNANNKKIQSTNLNVDYTTSTTIITINLSNECQISFDYEVSSEENFDKLSILLDNEYIEQGISGIDSKSYKTILTAGIHTLELSYHKDGSVSNNDDVASFYNFLIGDDFVVPNNCIYYTSTDGEIIDFSSVYRNDIISNTYENGQGIVVFNHTITTFVANLSYPCPISKLETIKLPKSISVIECGAFAGCIDLKEINIPTDNQYYCFENGYLMNKEKTELHTCVGSKSGYVNDIPNSIEIIKRMAFQYCDKITTLVFPNSGNIKKIENHAINSMYELTSVYLPTSLEKIGNFVFSYDSKLEEIAWNNFEGNNGIKIIDNMVIADYGKTLKAVAPATSGELIIPAGVTKLDTGAVATTSFITKVIVPEGVTEIGYWTFTECHASIYDFPSTLKKILDGQGEFETDERYGVEHGKSFLDKAQPTIICRAINPPSLENNYFFILSLSRYYTLKVPYSSINLYKNYTEEESWGCIERILPIEETFDVIDKEVFSLANEIDNALVKYTRSFTNTTWQPLYIPFSIPIVKLQEMGLTIAELNDTHQWDLDGDGVADSTRIEFFTLTSGATKANYPYLIKADSKMELSLYLEETDVMAAAETSIDCSTTKQLFTFTGTYSGIDGATIHDNHYYAISGGKLMQAIDSSVGLKPQRWYMKIENRDGSPMKYDAPGSKAPAIRIIVNGEQIEEFEETATSVEYVSEESGNDDYFTLDGQQIRKISRPGLYIKNGKKVIFK